MVQAANAQAVRPQIGGELFRLRQSETGVTANTDATCENYAIRYSFAPIWYYQVQTYEELVITPEHRLSIYLEDDEGSSAEWGDTQFVRVVVWDATMKRMQIIYEGRYMQAKEEQDDEKMAHFQMNEPVRLRAGDFIYVEGKCPNTIYTIDVSDSRFSIEMLRVRPTMFGV